jgi:hypothetical protein
MTCSQTGTRRATRCLNARVDADPRQGYGAPAVRRLTLKSLFGVALDLGGGPRPVLSQCGGFVARLKLALVVLPLFLITACSTGRSSFEIVDYRESGAAKRYREMFSEAYYDIDPAGYVQIALRRSQPGRADPNTKITQIIHIRSIWQSIPGRTVANETQINGTVSYSIMSGRIGATFEGAGSVFCRQDRDQDMLTGTLELAILKPMRKIAGGRPLFERAQLSGRFRAERDRRRLIRLVNETNRLFGPLPHADPSVTSSARR